MGPIASVSDLLRALRRQSWLILLVLAIGLPLAYVFALTRPYGYQATAVLGIETPPVDRTGEGGQIDLNRQLDEIQTALLARDNLLRQVEQLELFPDIDSEDIRLRLTREAITMTELIDPSQAWRSDLQPYGLSIVVLLDDSEKAAALANSLLASVLSEGERRTQTFADTALDQSATTLAFLDAEQRRLEEEIGALEAEISGFREANLASLPEGLDAQRDQLAELSAAKLTLDREILRFEASQGRVRSDVFDQERQLLAEQARILDEAITELETALAQAPAVERELGGMTRRLAGLETELTSVIGRRSEVSMAQQLTSQEEADHLFVIEEALPPQVPVTTSRAKIALVAGFAVVMLAFGAALAREILNPAIRTAAQMRREAGIEPVVVIPAVVSRATLRRRRSVTALFVLIFLVAAGVAGTVNAVGPLLSEAAAAG